MSKQQLTALDAAFLSLETPELPAHIGGLALLDPSTHPRGEFEYEGFVDFVAERLTLCPRFSWRLQEVPLGLDEPYWVEVDDLDLKSHIHRMALPRGAGNQELADLAAYLFERPIDRTRPLWEMFLIEGDQQTALLWKVHHTLMDGVSGAGLVELLFDLEADPQPRPRAATREHCRAGRPVETRSMLTRALRKGFQRPQALARHLGSAVSLLAGELTNKGRSAMASAPRTPFNGRVGGRRAVAWSSISLDRVLRLKSQLDVTVNDVVLGLTGEALRRYLDARGELPRESLVAAVPVSIRTADDDEMGNKVSEVSVDWGTHIHDPLERVLAIHSAMQHVKQQAKAERINPLKALSESLAPSAVSAITRLTAGVADMIPLPANAVVSNVRMTPVPLYVAGAQIRGMVPISLLPPSQGLNLTVLSYNGEMHFGTVADPDMVDSVWEIVDAIPKALVALEEAAARDPHYAD